MRHEVTITVDRADLDTVIREAKESGTDATWRAADRIYRATPPPAWEPTHEQVQAIVRASERIEPIAFESRAAEGREFLKAMHAEGLVA